MSGEPIVLEVTFRNPTSHTFTADSEDATGRVNFHWDWSDLEWVLKAELVGPEGKKRRWYKRSVIPSAADQIILPFVVLPGERTPTTRVILSRVFQQLSPGEHRLTWSIDMPCHAVEVRGQRLDKPLTLRATGSGTAAFRVMEADPGRLGKIAGDLLRRAQGEDSWPGHSFPLQLLATMPPSIALPTFQEYLGPMHRYSDKEEGHRDVEAALRGLIYIESPRAVDLIADIAAAQRSEGEKRPPNYEYRGYIHWRALTALSDMYHTTRREDVKQRIRERWKWRWQRRGRRAVRALQKLGAEVEWIDSVELIYKNARPLPPEEQHHSVWFGSRWRGGDEGLSHLPSVPQTWELGFYHLEGFDDSWLSVVPRIRGLRDLTVKGVPISNAGLMHVSQCASLRKLALAKLDLRDADLASLKPLRNLEELSFNSSSLDATGLKHLKDLPELTCLRLTLTGVTDAAMADLNPRLVVLHLGHNAISDKGLADLRHLQELQYLFLSSTEVTDAGMPHLNELPKLRELWLSGTRVTKAGVALLDRAQGPEPELDVLPHNESSPPLVRPCDGLFGEMEPKPAKSAGRQNRPE